MFVAGARGRILFWAMIVGYYLAHRLQINKPTGGSSMLIGPFGRAFSFTRGLGFARAFRVMRVFGLRCGFRFRLVFSIRRAFTIVSVSSFFIAAVVISGITGLAQSSSSDLT